jgi:pSer/pThr/pTyr-binding forkhead associated (FHA) protein
MNHSILVELARALSREDFVARLPDPVLVVLSELVKEEATGDEDTQVGEIGGMPGKVRNEVPAQFDALAVRKKRRGAEADRITLGRERTCDIVVRTPGISKQHACFLPGQPLRVEDIGSQNGTFVDGKRIPANQPVEVQPGAQLVFGDLVTRLISPTELYALLKTTRS